jgi:hypothetical protein
MRPEPGLLRPESGLMWPEPGLMWPEPGLMWPERLEGRSYRQMWSWPLPGGQSPTYGGFPSNARLKRGKYGRKQQEGPKPNGFEPCFSINLCAYLRRLEMR